MQVSEVLYLCKANNDVHKSVPASFPELHLKLHAAACIIACQFCLKPLDAFGTKNLP
jgi:hypothetical protein